MADQSFMDLAVAAQQVRASRHAERMAELENERKQAEEDRAAHDWGLEKPFNDLGAKTAFTAMQHADDVRHDVELPPTVEQLNGGPAPLPDWDAQVLPPTVAASTSDPAVSMDPGEALLAEYGKHLSNYNSVVAAQAAAKEKELAGDTDYAWIDSQPNSPIHALRETQAGIKAKRDALAASQAQTPLNTLIPSIRQQALSEVSAAEGLLRVGKDNKAPYYAKLQDIQRKYSPALHDDKDFQEALTSAKGAYTEPVNPYSIAMTGYLDPISRPNILAMAKEIIGGATYKDIMQKQMWTRLPANEQARAERELMAAVKGEGLTPEEMAYVGKPRRDFSMTRDQAQATFANNVRTQSYMAGIKVARNTVLQMLKEVEENPNATNSQTVNKMAQKVAELAGDLDSKAEAVRKEMTGVAGMEEFGSALGGRTGGQGNETARQWGAKLADALYKGPQAARPALISVLKNMDRNLRGYMDVGGVHTMVTPDNQLIDQLPDDQITDDVLRTPYSGSSSEPAAAPSKPGDTTQVKTKSGKTYRITVNG